MRPVISRGSLMLALLPILTLSACGSGNKAQEGKGDPALTGALGDQIKVDPGLAGQNAVSAGGIPKIHGSASDVAAARAEALALLGGAAAVKPLPALQSGEAGKAAASTIAGAAKAATTSAAGGKCTTLVAYSAEWAKRLPQPFPVYPRGKVTEAAGTDANGCALRAVTFTTAVDVPDVLTFYYTRALTAGYAAGRGQQGGDEILAGVKGQASFTVHARPTALGGSEVDLIASR